MRTRRIATQSGIAVLGLLVMGLMIVQSIVKVRSSLAYRYHQIYLGMPIEEVGEVLAGRRPSFIHVNSWGGGWVYEEEEGYLSITFGSSWEEPTRVIGKSFTPKESAPLPLRWFLKSYSAQTPDPPQVHGGIQ